MGDILNAYIKAPITENMWTTLGSEFGKDDGKSAVIFKALYGLNLAGAAFKSSLAKCMKSIWYEVFRA